MNSEDEQFNRFILKTANEQGLKVGVVELGEPIPKHRKYSICFCVKNMSRTVERSLRSILDQIDSDYEVVVVDGGSVDGTINILEKLQGDYDNLVLVFNHGKNIGFDRNLAAYSSSGEYLLLQLDADDYYDVGIQGFVETFHKLERRYSEDFYFKGNGINMVKKSFFLSIGGYRPLIRGEDRDLWRRLFSMDRIVWFNHEPFWRKIGYRRNKLIELKNGFNALVGDFQCGISYSSYVFWKLRNGVDIPFFCSLFLFLFSKTKEQFLTPVPFDSYGKLLEVVGSCSVET